MMKLLFVLTRYPGIGGIENVTTIITQHLRRQYDIEILSFIHEESYETSNNINILHMPDPTWHYTTRNKNYFENLLRAKQYDTVIYQDSYAPTEKIIIEGCDKYSIPVLIFEHNSPLFVQNKKSLDPITTLKGLLRRTLHPYLKFKEIQRKLYLFNACAKYILLSKSYISEFANLIKVRPNDPKITYIPNPLQPNIETHSEKEDLICCVCQLNKVKRIEEMLYIWSKVQFKLPTWKFLIIGDGNERRNLEKLARYLNLNRVEFIGFAKPESYYQRAKIFLMTSKYEGLPMTILEALQFNCVPIAYNSFSSIRDVIENGVNGIIIKNNDRDAFANAIEYIANDEIARMNFVANGKQKILEYELDNVLAKWHEVLRK